MEHHKSMYKNQHSRNLGQHTRENRKLQEDKRSKQRNDIYQNSRSILLSPILQDNTENSATKEEAFIKKFIEWKEAKKSCMKQEKQKPFITSVRGWQETTASKFLVPIGHHEGFRAPAGLKDPKEMEQVEDNKKPVAQGRRSIYTLVPTPPKKQFPDNNKVKHSHSCSARKILQTTQHSKIYGSNITQNGSETLAKNTNKATVSSRNISNKTPRDVKKDIILSTKKNTVVKAPNNLEKSKSKINPVQITTNKKVLEPRCLKVIPPPVVKPVSPVKKLVLGTAAISKVKPLAEKNKEMPPPGTKPVSPSKKKKLGAGAISKAKALADKNKENTKTRRKSPLKRANLAQNLKAKKPLNSKKSNISAVILRNNKISAETLKSPLDLAAFNPFSKYVTSTKVKESCENIHIEGISPIKVSPKKVRNNSSAKRNLLAKDYGINKEKSSPQNTKRFNFLRYSGAAMAAENEVENKEETICAVLQNGDKTLVNVNETTPTKNGPEERPANYLSPFVSVARGKVSLKKEKDKRNSVYLQDVSDLNNLLSQDNHNSPKYSLEVRRTLEAVRYFRKQLQDEIDRLHQLCDVWEVYKNQNLEKIQNASGEDMINVTIGQTRLLASKKFMQFKGLIDRCEARATGIGDVECDGSEGTKSITAVDLEGFWSMLGIQVDNLDKRFESLNRWKANDWLDPDEEKPKKKTITKVVKKHKAAPAVKSKPNPALRQMLRKMQDEMKKNKNKKNLDEIIVLTPSKQKRCTNSNNSTPRKSLDVSSPRRLSITVKDRKFFSHSPTVLSFCSPKGTSPMHRNSSVESPKINNDLNTSPITRNLRKSVLLTESSRHMSLNSKFENKISKGFTEANKINGIFIGADEAKTSTGKCVSPQSLINTPAPSGRKSILKTPGTARSKLRNVIFNEKLQVKKFNFLINDNDENGEDSINTHEEDLAKSCEDDSSTRTLTLRNRQVRLRPSCEIVIPKK